MDLNSVTSPADRLRVYSTLEDTQRVGGASIIVVVCARACACACAVIVCVCMFQLVYIVQPFMP